MEECTVDVDFKLTYRNKQNEVLTEIVTIPIDAMCEDFYVVPETLEYSITKFFDWFDKSDVQPYIDEEIVEVINIIESEE